MKDARNYPIPRPKDLTAADAVIAEFHLALRGACAFLEDLQAICEKTFGPDTDVPNAIKHQRSLLGRCAKLCSDGINAED